MKTLVSTSICLMVLLTGKTALADAIPSGCSKNALDARTYQTGIVQGRILVQRAWGKVNSCDKLEAFSDGVLRTVKDYPPPGATEASICRYSGLYEGVFQEIDSVWMACDGQCCSEGRAIGELAASLYCQLSILLGGLGSLDDFVRKPVYLCGFSFQTCCDASFLSTSITNQSEDAAGQLQQCLPYTEHPFFDIWDLTRKVQCAYTPPSQCTVEPAGLVCR
jgi:hypothetical protein